MSSTESEKPQSYRGLRARLIAEKSTHFYILFTSRKPVEWLLTQANRGTVMLKWALIFAIVSIIAGVLGFTGVAAGAAGIAKFLFFVFLAMFVAVLLFSVFAAKRFSKK